MVVVLLYSDSKAYALVNSARELVSIRILLGKKLSDSNTRFSMTRSISASWYSILGMGIYRINETALGMTTSATNQNRRRIEMWYQNHARHQIVLLRW